MAGVMMMTMMMMIPIASGGLTGETEIKGHGHDEMAWCVA
jgi:uncharacterized membrane protein (DUF441 family)